METPQDAPGAGATGALAAFITSAEIPAEVATRAIPLLLDTLAVTLAGGREPAALQLAATLPRDGSVAGTPSFWAPLTYRADDAALLFGVASHVLDYDDVSMLALCHPSAPVVASLLPLSCGRSGRAILAAFAVGTEVMIRVGEAMGFRPYGLGFHATAILGPLGAAAAGAHLMGLDARRTGHALAIAASLAGGIRANFGTPVKSLHVGLAAAHGLKAAQWAAAGVTGAAEALDGPVGFLHAFSGGETSTLGTVRLGAPFALVEPGFEQKRYPCCYMLHKIAEAALALRHAHGLDLAAVRAAHVEMPPGGSGPLIHPRPRTGLEALFSGPYCVAAALADGEITLASFTDEQVMRPQIQARLRDITFAERPGAALSGADIAHAPVTVQVTTATGQSLSRTVTLPPGSPADPLTPAQLRAKWRDCLLRAAPHADAETVEHLFDQGLRLGEMETLSPWLSELRATLARPG